MVRKIMGGGQSFSTALTMSVAVALAVVGCGKTPAPPLCPTPTFAAVMQSAPAPDPDVVARVLAAPEPVPHKPDGTPAPEPPAEPGPPGVFDQYLGDVGQRLSTAAEASPDAEPQSSRFLVFFYSARWCKNCPLAKKNVVPWLQVRGYEVVIVETDKWSDRQYRDAGIVSLPCFAFMERQGKATDVVQRGLVFGGMDDRGQPNESLFTEAFKKCPPQSMAVGAFGQFELPTIRLADLVPLVAGSSKSLGWGVSYSIPKNVTWTIRKSGSSVFLDFKAGSCPQISWPARTVNLQSLEFNPQYVEAKTNAWLPMLKTIRENIDYTPPSGFQTAPTSSDNTTQGKVALFEGGGSGAHNPTFATALSDLQRHWDSRRDFKRDKQMTKAENDVHPARDVLVAYAPGLSWFRFLFGIFV